MSVWKLTEDQKLPRVLTRRLKFVLGQNALLVHFYPVGIVPLHAVVLKLYRTPLQTLKSFCLRGRVGCIKNQKLKILICLKIIETHYMLR